MKRSLLEQDHTHRAVLLLGIALISVALWQTAFGSFLLYPFTILATWFHEMGHGIAAMLTGSHFDSLVIFSDGSGYAQILRPADAWRLTDAIISASGPLGPAIAGAMLILASRSAGATRTALMVLGSALILSTIIWVRSIIGWVVLPGLGVAIMALARRGSLQQQRLGIQILGVQAAISTWKQLGYLFSSGGSVGGQMHRSDTGAIADALLLPYWVWGALISALITALLWWSLKASFRR